MKKKNANTKKNKERMITKTDCDSVKNSNASLEDAIRNLTSTDEVSNIKKSLTEFFEEWLCSECASESITRSTMITHYNALMTLLTAIEEEVKKAELEAEMKLSGSILNEE